MPNNTALNPAVILNMHYTGLGIARNLSGAGIDVYALSAKRLFGNRSKFCTFVESPDTEEAGEECKQFLCRFAERFDHKPVLFPTRDQDIQFILRWREALEGSFLIPYPATGIVQEVLNKQRLFEHARAVGISCPRSLVLSDPAALGSAVDRISLPGIVKPVVASDWRRQDVWDLVGRRKAVVFDSLEALEAFYARIRHASPVVDVQEYIAGPDSNLVVLGSFVDPAHGAFDYVTGRKLIQYPPGTGTGVVVQAETVEPIVEPCHALLKALGYYGISEIEFKYDDLRGEYFLIEMNPRHWDQHRLATALGVNLSRAVYASMTGAIPAPVARRRPAAVRWVAEDGFVRSFLSNLRHPFYSWSVYARVVFGRKVFAVLDRADRGPIRQVLADALGSVKGALRRRLARTAPAG